MEDAAADPALTPRPARLSRRALGCVWVALAVALAPFVPAELPSARGQAQGHHVHSADELAAPLSVGEILAGGQLELQKVSGGAGSGGASGRRGWQAFAPLVPASLRDAAVQLRLSLASAPEPTMHLSAHERVVLFPEQGPPLRRA